MSPGPNLFGHGGIRERRVQGRTDLAQHRVAQRAARLSRYPTGLARQRIHGLPPLCGQAAQLVRGEPPQRIAQGRTEIQQRTD